MNSVDLKFFTSKELFYTYHYLLNGMYYIALEINCVHMQGLGRDGRWLIMKQSEVALSSMMSDHIKRAPTSRRFSE